MAEPLKTRWAVGSELLVQNPLIINLTPFPTQSSWNLPQVAGVSIANAPEGLVLSVVSPSFAIRGHG
jgi:hypothetical protein